MLEILFWVLERLVYVFLGVIIIVTVNFCRSSMKIRPRTKFFLNIFCLNKSAAIRKSFSDKNSSKLMGGLLGTIATRLVSDQRFTQDVGRQMTAAIPQRMNQEFGIKAECTFRFKWQSMIVIELNVLGYDKVRIVEKVEGKQRSIIMTHCLDFLGWSSSSSSLDTRSPMEQAFNLQFAKIVGDRMQIILPKEIEKDKLVIEAGIEVSVICNTEEEQADFLMSFLRENESDTMFYGSL